LGNSIALSGGSWQLDIEVGDLPLGIYVLQVQGEEETQQYKVVIE
jgi:hypothetical protein